ncbi:hypothetical protein MYX76_18425, partial [Desulfobacterota bacterium AH_259_B03_O07]|nr:hypothetical protein [Desulfobacterota bacterium AH_259_B03_O07]
TTVKALVATSTLFVGGTTSPAEILSVQGNILTSATTTTGGLTATGTVFLATDGGFVGIGTRSPTQKLHLNNGVLRISGGGNESTGEINLDDGITEFTGNSFQIRKQTSDYWAVKSVSTGNDLALYVDNDVMQGIYIKNGGGNVGIGTTSPTDILTIAKTQSETDPVANGADVIRFSGLSSASGSTLGGLEFHQWEGTRVAGI